MIAKSPNPVKCHFCKYPLNKRICCDDRAKYIGQIYKNLYDQGWTIRQIAENMNVSYGKVHKLLGMVQTEFRSKQQHRSKISLQV